MESPPKTKKQKENINRLKHIIGFIAELNWFISASIALLAFFLMKRYVMDVERVNSNDMLATYNYGDALLVTKINDSYITNDLVYFEYPVHDSIGRRTYLFQRVFGLPGDSLELRDKIVNINGIRVEDTSTVKHNYFVKGKHMLDSAFLKRHNLLEGGKISNDPDYSFSLTGRQAEALSKNPLIKSVELRCEKKAGYDESCFPFSAHFKWNMDHYGSIYIPGMNDTLALDTVNIALYASIIRDYEKNHLEIKKDSIFINRNFTRSYVVKKNYFFVLGDNRDNANDSRVWGFLPENYIIGKVNKPVKRSMR